MPASGEITGSGMMRVRPPAPSSRRAVMLAGGVIGLAGLAAYANTFSVPFLFDDTPSILDNPPIQHLWPIWDVLAPRADYGFTVSGRPMLNLSLAICYAVSGTSVWSYHALNLLIHLLVGLTLFGIVRRTLQQPVPCCRSRLAGDSSRGGSVLQTSALPIALTVALLWTLHPLQTESVTYIIQRTESLMGLFFLMTLYCFIRGTEYPTVGTTKTPRHEAGVSTNRVSFVSLCLRGSRSGSASWFALSILSCLAGMGTKEVMATAPVLVLLYDRTFVSGSFREAWRRRRWLHLGLAATWIPLTALVSNAGWNRGGTAGFNVGISPGAYWFTQFEAVACYLKQAVWPHPLIFEYGTFWLGLADAAPYALVVLPVAAATLVALWRWPVGGFLGSWFFVILAPTSLVPGTIQMIVEHRMYLPLAAVIALVVGVAVDRLGRPALAPFLALALAAGVLTGQRNAVYRTDLTLWQETVAHRPGSAIAQSSLGTALYHRGRLQEAMHHYRISLRLNPNLAPIHFNLGLTFAALGKLNDAAAQFAEAVRLNPRFFPAHHQLGITLTRMGQPGEALAHFAQAASLMPTRPEIQCEWGLALFQLGRVPEAILHYREALRLKPDYAEAECDLGVALDRMDHPAEAVECFQRALRANPDLADAHFDLGLAFSRLGSADQAATQYAETVRLDPKHVAAQLNLGIALAKAGRLPEALEHLELAVQLGPGLPEAHCNLGIVLAQQGRLAEAVSHYQKALQLEPGYAAAHYNLGNSLLELRRLPEAAGHFEQAVRIDPRFEAAREMLSRLQAAKSAGTAP
jgi:tetratricopeptide (TPR) repeat protein